MRNKKFFYANVAKLLRLADHNEYK